MGTLAEDIVAPGIPDVFKTVFGVEPSGHSVRSSFRDPDDPGQSQEFDVVAWGGGYFLVNETRKRAKPEDVPAVLELLLEARRYFPQAESLKVVGSLASFYLDPRWSGVPSAKACSSSASAAGCWRCRTPQASSPASSEPALSAFSSSSARSAFEARWPRGELPLTAPCDRRAKAVRS